MKYALMSLAILVAGCAQTAAMRDLPGGATWAPESCRLADGALAAASLPEPEIVELPSLSSWPVTMAVAGPLYALVELNPLVAQMGILADADRADAGLGFGLVVGYRMITSGTSTLGAEFIFQRSGHHNPSSNVEGTAVRTGGAARLTFGGDAQLQPFVVGGGGFYSLTFDGMDSQFNLGGMGLMMGGGVDYTLSRAISLRGGMELHLWDAAEKDGDGGMAATLTLGIGAAFSF